MPRKEIEPPTPHPDAEGFSQIPEGLLLPFLKCLTKGEILVFIALIHYQREPGIYSRSASDIANVCGMSIGTVKNAESELVRKRFLVRHSKGHTNHTAEFELSPSLRGIAEWLPKQYQRASRISYPDSTQKSNQEGHEPVT